VNDKAKEVAKETARKALAERLQKIVEGAPDAGPVNPAQAKLVAKAKEDHEALKTLRELRAELRGKLQGVESEIHVRRVRATAIAEAFDLLDDSPTLV
jgi:hypothetical protein